jgi:hypothetical protein
MSGITGSPPPPLTPHLKQALRAAKLLALQAEHVQSPGRAPPLLLLLLLLLLNLPPTPQPLKHDVLMHADARVTHVQISRGGSMALAPPT